MLESDECWCVHHGIIQVCPDCLYLPGREWCDQSQPVVTLSVDGGHVMFPRREGWCVGFQQVVVGVWSWL